MTEDIRTESKFVVSSQYIDAQRQIEAFGVWLTYSGHKIVYQRSYPKIQDILSEIGGAAGTLLLIISIFSYDFSKLKMYE